MCCQLLLRLLCGQSLRTILIQQLLLVELHSLWSVLWLIAAAVRGMVTKDGHFPRSYLVLM